MSKLLLYIGIPLVIIYRYILTKVNKKVPEYNYDIIIEPGGVYGFYTLGVCHYIKNNYKIDNKSIIGFSAGSWNVVFLAIMNRVSSNLNDIKFLISVFNYKFMCNVKNTENIVKLKNCFMDNINFRQLNMKNKIIGITTDIDNLYEVSKFISLNDIVNACMVSSFLPYYTLDEFIKFYRGRMCFDGGIFYTFFMKNKIKKNALIISWTMFDRWEETIIPGSASSNLSAYDLYILGYR